MKNKSYKSKKPAVANRAKPVNQNVHNKGGKRVVSRPVKPSLCKSWKFFGVVSATKKAKRGKPSWFRRLGMRRKFVFRWHHRPVVTLVIAFAILSLLFTIYFIGFQSTVKEPVTIQISQGASVSSVARQLKGQGLIASENEFKAIVAGFGGRVRYGTYDIPAKAGHFRIAKMIARGEVASTIIVIPEGFTVQQIIATLNANRFLEGEACDMHSATFVRAGRNGNQVARNNRNNSSSAPRASAEREVPGNPCPLDGDLFPDTYRVAKGTSRAAVIDLMRRKMQEIERNWIAAGRKRPTPLKDWNDIITLASIVQKETPRVSEMPTVASVFINRLRKGMRLQADPTVVYAITDGLGDMRGRPLFTGHLKVQHPHNTYVNHGLPPHPIANVGRAAIRAVLNPADTNYYFFVADGTGGHVFSRTYDEHNIRRAEWREIKRTRKEDSR
ncbi:MAG: endolytic transglycosylase MltG [Alphaproteobacteria bacterium]|nr:endolytic transglycosylase MltG [Alphaproteobacteria bacterium]